MFLLIASQTSVALFPTIYASRLVGPLYENDFIIGELDIFSKITDQNLDFIIYSLSKFLPAS